MRNVESLWDSNYFEPFNFKLNYLDFTTLCFRVGAAASVRIGV